MSETDRDLCENPDKDIIIKTADQKFIFGIKKDPDDSDCIILLVWWGDKEDPPMVQKRLSLRAL